MDDLQIHATNFKSLLGNLWEAFAAIFTLSLKLNQVKYSIFHWQVKIPGSSTQWQKHHKKSWKDCCGVLLIKSTVYSRERVLCGDFIYVWGTA